jgi:hypothetical protein
VVIVASGNLTNRDRPYPLAYRSPIDQNPSDLTFPNPGLVPEKYGIYIVFSNLNIYKLF